ncbi:MAG: primosomal protein N' [Gemmatimonadota bacterium]|nr:primosomal protein N' [Gemmatimonadota bacterium]
MLAEVAIPLPVFRTFTYAVPAGLESVVSPGTRVLVPFGKRGDRVGWVDRITDQPPSNRTKPISSVLEEVPSIPGTLLNLCRWAADYYVTPLGQVIRTAVPAVLSAASTETIAATASARNLSARTSEERPSGLSDLETVILDWLASAEGAQPVARLRKERGERGWWPAIRRLEEKGLLTVGMEAARTEPASRTVRIFRLARELPSLLERDQLFGRAKRQRECWEWVESVGGSMEVPKLVGDQGFTYAIVNALVERGLARIDEEEVMRDPYSAVAPPSAVDLQPTAAQGAAIRDLTRASREKRPGTFLLRGVTGSGKTLVYIELLREVVQRQGRAAIVLVPEIALTPQTVGRFRAVFGDQVAVLHSALSDGERYDEWRALRSGRKRIAVGARSAIFAPLSDLGAIIVDEEHEATYKQSDTEPRYHARELAVVRADQEGAVCLLGSATPSLESWVNATSGKYRLIELPERATGQRMPEVRVVDLREERKAAGQTGQASAEGTVLSPPLRDAIAERLRRGEQTILLLNRRGYANFVQCRECGEVWICPSCAVSLTYHRRRGRMTCHYCQHEEATPSRCTRCSSTDINFRGVGTEQVERSVIEQFPDARLVRMDVDTTSAKWSHHNILEQVGRGEIDILLGTQMIAKGLDFPNVTLVGVINADVGINLPDFRATERTFQLVTQVAGRAGRGPKGGEVFIQTSLPKHHAIACSVAHDFEAFARTELEARRSPLYPPFCRLVNIVVSGLEEGATRENAQRAVDWIAGLLRAREIQGVEIVGPAPSPIERIRNRWRWHLLLRSISASQLGHVTRYFAEQFQAGSAGDIRIAIDRDPVALL